ncbi:MAG: protein translocase subunit SecF [Oscillospiraceae bacterium]|nr:protein translocase subunit SecF [Oscillospiraceae bacterium]
MIDKYRGFSFTKHFKLFGIISLLLISVGLVSLILTVCGVPGLFNFDIDFVGGTTFEFRLPVTVDKSVTDRAAELYLDAVGKAPSSVTSSGENGLRIKALELSDEEVEAVRNAIVGEYPINVENDYQVERVSASVGRDLTRSAFLASAVAVALILIYIGFRFEFKSGVAAVCALVHDLLVMLSFYVIFRIPFNINFIAAALTILGYSINATIVVFDRVRENRKNMKTGNFGEIVDTSIWDTMSRSINTTVTTLIVMVMLLIMGVSSIRNFALPICIGIVCGCYSSVCISGPLWNKMNHGRVHKA